MLWFKILLYEEILSSLIHFFGTMLNSSELSEQIDKLQGTLYKGNGNQNSESIDAEQMMSSLVSVREQLHQSRRSANTNLSALAKLYKNNSA